MPPSVFFMIGTVSYMQIGLICEYGFIKNPAKQLAGSQGKINQKQVRDETCLCQLHEINKQGQRVVSKAAIPEDGEDYYCMHHEDEVIQATHDPKLDAEGEDENEF